MYLWPMNQLVKEYTQYSDGEIYLCVAQSI